MNSTMDIKNAVTFTVTLYKHYVVYTMLWWMCLLFKSKIVQWDMEQMSCFSDQAVNNCRSIVIMVAVRVTAEPCLKTLGVLKQISDFAIHGLLMVHQSLHEFTESFILWRMLHMSQASGCFHTWSSECRFIVNLWSISWALTLQFGSYWKHFFITYCT